MSNPNRSKIPAILTSGIICIALFAIGGWSLLNKQLILDQINVWQYQPSSEVTALVDRSGMGEYGEFLFLASQPLLAKSADEVKTFNSTCNDVEKTTSILGCYSDYKIYLYNVTDQQLDGARETTAVHETLHAAYLRLGSSERSLVNKLLEAEAEKLKNNAEFAGRMAYYDRAEPGQRDNELHSIIGTETASVSPELETYYKKYFTDRQKVVALNAKYTSVFQQLAARAKTLSTELNSLSDSIKAKSVQYNSDVQALNNSITAFNNDANGGAFTSQAQFNSRRAVLTNRVEYLKQTRTNINDEIAEYDELLAEYNSIASQSEKLNNSLDSTLAPAPSV